MKISLFCSSIRPHLWNPLLDSLKSNKLEYEVVMAGFIDEALSLDITNQYPEFKYIKTGDIKPAQCYEIARKACTGDLIGWISDDCIFSESALDKIYEYYNLNLHMIFRNFVFAVKNTDKECENNDLNDQRFFPRNLNTPQVATIGFMNREYLDSLGGLDNRYVYGKWEVDICMRVLEDNGKIIKLEDIEVQIEHTQKNGHNTNDWSGVNEDSETLENSWVIGGYKDFERPLVYFDMGQPVYYFPISNREVTLRRLDKFNPYELPISLEESQSLRARWV